MASADSADLSKIPFWARDLHTPLKPRPKNAPAVLDPPGFAESLAFKRAQAKKSTSSKKEAAASAATAVSSKETDSLKLKKSWEVALAPAKALPMNAIMMYMSGNTLQIFSIMMVFMLFKNPIMGLLQINEAFRRYESPSNKEAMLAVKGCYVVMQLLALGLGIWKVNSMGLLPNTRSDWLAWEVAREPLETAVFTF